MNETEQWKRLHELIDGIEACTLQIIDERDALRAALLAIRDHITPATAYPETVAWVQATVDGVVKE